MYNRSRIFIPVDLRLHFPSLFSALRRLDYSVYDAGWLVGCVYDVASILLPPILTKDTDERLQVLKQNSSIYISKYGGVDESTPYGSNTHINIEELVLCLQEHINAHYQLSLSTFTILNDLNRHFKYTVRSQSIGYLQELHAYSIDRSQTNQHLSRFVEDFEEGFNQGQNRDLAFSRMWQISQTQSTIRSSDTATQYEPDDSVMEFQPTGSRVARYEYSTPFNKTTIPKGECAICRASFRDTENGKRIEEWDLVVAKCPSRHVFHGDCLDLQVNMSAMPNSNKCPLDRHKIGPARGRCHPMTDSL